MNGCAQGATVLVAALLLLTVHHEWACDEYGKNAALGDLSPAHRSVILRI